MNLDFWGLAGLTSILTGILIWLLGLLVLILVIREGVSRGLRSHQLWMEKTGRTGAPTPYGSITPPSSQF